MTKGVKSYYRRRKWGRFGIASPGEPVRVGLTEKAPLLERGPTVELRIGEGKDVRIAWLAPNAARRVGYRLLVAAAEVQARKKRRRRRS